MKDSIFLKIIVIISSVMVMIMFSSCKKADNNYIISEAQRTELEEFLSTFTVKPVLSDYLKNEEGAALLYFTVYHLVESNDDRVRYDEPNDDYIVSKLAVDEKIEQYFGVDVYFSPYLSSVIRLKDE